MRDSLSPLTPLLINYLNQYSTYHLSIFRIRIVPVTFFPTKECSMKSIIRKLIPTLMISYSFTTSAFTPSAAPPRTVVLSCPPLAYVFSCSIPRTAHPQYGTNCWYRTGGKGYLMKSDRRFGFYNDIVELTIRDSTHVTGVVREVNSGRSAYCQQKS